MANTLRCYRMNFEPLGLDGIKEDRLGKRSKLGGEPDWEQNNETPICAECGQKMIFIGQLDSIEHDEDHNPHRVDCLSDEQKYMFGDVGMIYVFFCFDCLETTSIFQCT